MRFITLLAAAATTAVIVAVAHTSISHAHQPSRARCITHAQHTTQTRVGFQRAARACIKHRHQPRYSGLASAYGPGLYGNTTACGQILRRDTLGVAHPSLPCGTRLTLRYSGHSVAVRVIDRGPYAAGRALDLTTATTTRLGYPTAAAWGVRRIQWTRP